MSVVRVRHQKEFVCLSNSVLQDPNLSLEAIGLWSHCMSRPENWIFRVTQLASQFNIGVKKIYKIINELIAKGYCFKGQKKEVKPGSLAKNRPVFTGIEYVFFGLKMSERDLDEMSKIYSVTEYQKQASLPVLRKPENGLAQDGLAQDDKLQNTYNIQITEKREEAPPPPHSPERNFHYKRVTMKMERYQKLCDEFTTGVIQCFMDRLDEYADINPKRFKQYACHAAVIRKWIREESDKKPLGFKTSASPEWIFKVKERVKLHPEVSFGLDSIAFSSGQSHIQIKFNDKEQILSRLKVMGISIDGLS